ncbi:MAG: SBBP repeat-containing protein, partial [Methylacidiphilales bacterium]|nr:SBBP repeat-containing protein [Candidatus Methylacidiphilales bacterium]
MKFNANGTRLWGTYYGGAGGEDYFASVVVDPNDGSVYLAGRTGSLNDIASGGHQNAYGGEYHDAFLVKFNASGTRLWGSYYGGGGSDYGISVAVDSNDGSVYLSGATSSTNGIASGGYQNTPAQGYFAKFTSSGTRVWGSYINSEAYGITVDPNDGSVYVAGWTTSTSGIASGGHQNTYGGNWDASLVKFNASGTRLWGTYYGGVGGEGLSDWIDTFIPVVDPNDGSVYLAGDTTTTWPVDAIASGGHQNTYGGGSWDAFLVKFNASGTRQWGTYYGGGHIDEGNSVAVDPNDGSVYLAGSTSSWSPGASIASGGYQNAHGGGSDAYLVKFNASGTRVWGTYYGTSGWDMGFSVAVDPNDGSIYLAGETSSTSGIASGGHQNTYGGIYDAFLVKFSELFADLS